MDDQKKILEMLAEGKINAAEAQKLIDALGNKELHSSAAPQFIFIQIEPKKDHGDRVRIKVPFKLLRAGVKLAAFIPLAVQDKIKAQLGKRGLDFDFSQATRESMEEFLVTLSEFSVDIDNDNESIKIYCA